MNHDHQLNYLHHDQNGFIGYCSHCNSIHLAFGVVMFAMEQEYFEKWYHKVANEYAQFKHIICPHAKHFVFDTESKNMRLVFNLKEMHQLIQLIEPGLIVLEARRIINQSY
jgi:hypothetical protein